MKKTIAATLILSLTLFSAMAQRQNTNNSNGWFMYFGDHKLSEKWGIHLEAQFRRNNIITSPQQLLLRTGINYHFTPNVFATAGYCFVETYPYGEFAAKSDFPEHRLWEQLQVKNQVERFEITSRFRLEQRWVQSPVQQGTTTDYAPGPAVYSNRFRILNRVSMPFKGKSIVDKSWYVSAYDELMG